MRIGTLAKQAHVSRDTIRYYERIGLLEPAGRRLVRAYKEYSYSTLLRLHRIRYAKRLGFTLVEIREYIASWMSGEVSSKTKIDWMQKKRFEILAKLAELHEIELALSTQIAQCEEAGYVQ